MSLKLYSGPVSVKLAMQRNVPEHTERRKSFALETEPGSSSVFVLWPSRLWGSVSSLVKWGINVWLHAPAMRRASSLMVSTGHSADKWRFPTGGGKTHTKLVYLLSFPRSWKRFLFCYSLLLFFIVSDRLVFWCFEIFGFFFFILVRWNYVKALPTYFTFIHASELFRSVHVRPPWGISKAHGCLALLKNQNI